MADPISLVVELADKVTGPARQAGSSLTDLADKVGPVGEVLGGPVVAGAAMAVASLVALGTAVGAVTVGFAALGIEASEARNRALATLSALGGGAEQANALYESLGAARDQLGMTREQLVPLTAQLLGMGVAADSIPSKLKALATVKATGIEGGVAEYLAITKNLEAHVPVTAKALANLYKTGVNVNEIAAAMGVSVKQLQAGLKAGTLNASAFQSALDKAVTDKGAGALANQAKSLGAQWDNLKEKFLDLFEGVDASPLLDALKDLFSVVDQINPSGQAAKAGITGVLNTIFKTAAKVLPYIKIGIEKFIIVVLKAYIAIKTHWSLISPILKSLAIGFGVIVGIVIAVVGVVLGFVAVLGALGTALAAGVVALVGFVAQGLVALYDWVKGAPEIAAKFIEGLVSGITGGAAKVIDSVKGLGKSVLSGMKSVLGISSPSKEFAKLGEYAGAGFAMGLDGAVGGVETSAGQMGAASASSVSTPHGSGSSSRSGGDMSVTFAPGSIVVDGAGKSALEITETMIALVFQKIANMQGLDVNPVSP